ncbi:MAG TPA: HSP18 transcriptional regulator [Actinospica sp.]|jgi:hypothetical protein|nr:HSP18 transcriptional regulator [Actinospica sp.]
MVRSTGPGAAAPGEHTGQTEAAAGLERIEAAIDTARSEPAGPDSAQFLVALALLRQVREQLAGWEPELIDAARANGASWAQLAPALGVASRQAAERRALRLRPGTDHSATTGDQRVTAERDRRAGIRAVDAYARDHSADLRVLAAQVGGVTGLPQAARAPMAALHEALGGTDAAALLAPLLAARAHLGDGHEQLTEQIDALSGGAESARSEAQARRR